MRKKKTGKRKLIKDCDVLFAKKVRMRGYCEAQGEGGKSCGGLLQCAHIIPRTCMSTRWDEKNALCLCYTHHIYWAHKDPLGFAEYVKRYCGLRRYNGLQKKRNIIKQWSEAELVRLKKKLTC